MILACEEHVEWAIDDYIDHYELSPEVEAVQSGAGKCHYCSSAASYAVGFERGES